MTSDFKRVRKLHFQPSPREIVDIINQLVEKSVQEGGALKLGIKTVTTTPYTVAADDQFLRIDCSANAVTIVLPAIASSNERELTFKKVDLSNNALVIDGNSTETIDGQEKRVIHGRYEGLTIRGDSASEWNIKGWF